MSSEPRLLGVRNQVSTNWKGVIITVIVAILTTVGGWVAGQLTYGLILAMGDWPLIAGLIPWQQAVALQSNDFLNACVWLYETVFSALSSAYRTTAAAGFAVIAFVLNLRWFG